MVGQLYYNWYERNPQKAQLFISNNGVRLTTLWNNYVGKKVQQWKNPYLQSIISLTDSQNLDKFLHVKSEAKDQLWMPMTFKTSSCTELKTNMTL